MKSLVVFYSRTGTTEKVAKVISKRLKCDIEEIFDAKVNRNGIKGWLISGNEAYYKKCPKIKKIKKTPSSYDVVIIGTPVWAFTMSSPVRTYISQNRKHFRKVAFFCTHEGMPRKTLDDMGNLCGKKSVSSFEFTRKEVINGRYIQKIKKFIDEIKG